MTVALALSLELLRFTPQSPGTERLFAALVEAALSSGMHVTDTTTYRGGSDLLMIWGPGSPTRFEAMRQQIASGGHSIVWDASYWNRASKMRISIDAAHPQAWVMKRDWPASRLQADGVTIEDAWDPQGPVIVAGLGDKARVQYGAAVIDAWEAEMMAECRRRGWTVAYRAKRGAQGPIEQALRGASLLISWHSNAAIDAIRLGIPVVCRDGAAAAVYGPEIPDEPRPIAPALRDRYLANLAYWQWAPSEAAAFWVWLSEVLA